MKFKVGDRVLSFYGAKSGVVTELDGDGDPCIHWDWDIHGTTALAYHSKDILLDDYSDFLDKLERLG